MNRIRTCCYKIGLIIRFIIYIFWEIIVSNFRVAYDVITPRSKAKPGVISIPLELDTPIKITLFANIISLTPGSLTLEISEDHRTLFVHAMFVDDVEALRNEIKEKFERPILEILA